MRKALRVSALLLALSCPALAGEIHIPPAPQPPPSVPVEESEAKGDMGTPPIVQIALNLLALF